MIAKTRLQSESKRTHNSSVKPSNVNLRHCQNVERAIFARIYQQGMR